MVVSAKSRYQNSVAVPSGAVEVASRHLSCARVSLSRRFGGFSLLQLGLEMQAKVVAVECDKVTTKPSGEEVGGAQTSTARREPSEIE